MRATLILLIVQAACGNGLVQLDNIVPFEGGLNETLYIDVPITNEWTLEGASHEVDVSRGYCQSTSGTNAICTQEPFGPHYALVVLRNHNDVSEIEGTAGTAQLDQYSVDIRGRGNDAPEINGFVGRLGVSVQPQRLKTFPIVLLGLNAKSEFRSAAPDTAYEYNLVVVFKGPGGLELEGGTTVLLGDFDKCPDDSVATNYCSPY